MPAQPARVGHFFVPKDYKDQFEGILNSNQIAYMSAITDIKKYLEEEDDAFAKAALKRSGNAKFYTEIHRYDEVNEYMERMAREYPSIVKFEEAGKTFQGRPINYLKISTTNFQDTTKPIVFLQSLLHAREWVTLPATLYAIEKLLVNVTESDLVNDLDWIIMPIANPDGYEFTHTNSRFWRKNRRDGIMIANLCVGVDLNRNFDSFWSTESSSSVCSDVYHGSRAFSEPETQAIKSIFDKYSDRIGFYADIHSFGSIILWGYGNGQLPPNALQLQLVGVNSAQAIDNVKWQSKPNYVVGNIMHILYAASGGSTDYASAIGVPLSFCYELPGHINTNGVNGFLVQPEFVQQAGEETWEGLKVVARYVRDNNLKNIAV
ncbi:hypothetical protein ACJJTC_013097 [Scirpophaga incertulas]